MESAWQWKHQFSDHVITEVTVEQGCTVGDYAPFVGEQNLLANVTGHETGDIIAEFEEGNLRVRWSPKLISHICVEALPDCPIGSYTLEFDVAGAHYTLPVRVTEGKFDYGWRLASDRDTPCETLTLNSADSTEIRFELFRDGQRYRQSFENDFEFDAGGTKLQIKYRENKDGVGSIVLLHDNAHPGEATLTYLRNGEAEATVTITVQNATAVGYKLEYKLNGGAWQGTDQPGTVQVGDEIRVKLLRCFDEASGLEPVEVPINRDYHLTVMEESEKRPFDYIEDKEVCLKDGNFALLEIPFSAAGAELRFETNLDELNTQLSFDLAVQGLDGKLELQTWHPGGGNAGTWEAVTAAEPVKLQVGGSQFFRMMYKEQNDETQIPLTERLFDVRRDNYLGAKYYGNGTAEVFALSAPQNGEEIRITYGVRGNFWNFRGYVTVEGQSYTWYEVGGEELHDANLDITGRENKQVTLGLKQGERQIPLTPENLRLISGVATLDFDKVAGTVTVTTKSLGVSLNYLIGDDESKPLGIGIINEEAGPYFSGGDVQTISAYANLDLKPSDSGIKSDPGTLVERLRGGPHGNIGADMLNLKNFSILDENGTPIHKIVTENERQKVVCEFFSIEHYIENDNSKSDLILIRALKNGSATIRYEQSGYDVPNNTRYAELNLTVDVKELSYGLYTDDGQEFNIREGNVNSTTVVGAWGLSLKQINDGVPGADLTDKIINIEPGECYDAINTNNEHVWDRTPENTSDCALWLGKNEEGRWTIYNRNIAVGQYHLQLLIQVEGLEEPLTFEVDYTVDNGRGSTAYYYVSANNSINHKPSDFPSIQAALDAAVAEVNVGTRYVVLRHGVYDGDQIDGPGGDGCLELHFTRYRSYIDFFIKGEGNVTIKGSLNHTPDGVSVPVVLSNLTFSCPNKENPKTDTAIIIHREDQENEKGSISLQNITIDGYKTGVDGHIYAEYSTNTTIKNCGVGLELGGFCRDTANHVLRNMCFEKNDVAIHLNKTSHGQFKIRQSSFEKNEVNIEAKLSQCDYINAAFNDYVHGGKGSIADRFIFPESDNSRYFYSPYTRKGKEVTRAVATSEYYIDPEQMNGLIIDADEAKQVINSSNFKDQNISIDIVTTVENEETGLTESKPYATWNFGEDVTANAESMDFTPRIDLELPEESQAVVDQAGVTNYQPVSFLHSGELPATATVNVTATEDLGNGNLYLYKVEGDQLVLQEEKVTFDGEEYTFDRPTCSDYVITDTLVDTEDGSEGPGTAADHNNSSGTADSDDDTSADTNDYISGSEVEDKLSESKGDKATISIISRNKVAKKAFAELAKTDKTLVLRGEGYSWSIEGSEITKPLAAAYFKTGVRSTSPYARKIDKLVDTLNYQIIQTEHHGELPGKMTLRLKVKDELRHSLCYLYYYNPTNGEAEAISSGLKADGKGYVEIVFDEHLSTYFLTDRPLRGAVNSISTSGGKANPGTGAF